jgi:hypothetical protein
MYAQMTQIHSLTLIHRNRLLPIPGEVNVRLGQQVNPMDVVAEAFIPSHHYLVDVGRVLGARSSSDAEKLISRKPGEVLEKNDIIAETGGMFSRVIRTPGPGKVISISKGRVLIETESEQIALKAGLAGKISQVIPDRGVTIETYGALIQGVWGNSKINFGPLVIDEASLGGELQTSALGVTARGTIILAGYCSSEDMLKMAATAEIGGLILGSLSSNLTPVAQILPFPVIVLEGFGELGLDELSLRILTTNAGREVSINAVKWNRLTGDRPEVYIPLPSEGEPYKTETSFAVGQKVRVHSGIYAGRIGKIDQLLPGLTLLPSGLRASSARVKFDQKEGEVFPLANLDVVQLKD